MNTRSCFFIGHREADEKLLPVLKAEVQRHIEELGVTEFIVGHYGGFDHLAVQAVCAAKKEHPDICLSVLLPYHPAERPVKPSKGVDGPYHSATRSAAENGRPHPLRPGIRRATSPRGRGK